MKPREALAAHAAGDLDGIALVRALVSHDGWLVPAGVGPDGPAPLVDVRDGERWALAFGDREAFGDRAETWLELPGTSLFGGLGDDLAGLDVDGGSPHAVHYRRVQIPALREMAAAVEVHRILHGEEVAGAFQKLAAYEGYRVVMRLGPDDRSQMVLAPDSRGRSLVAVFTAEDTVRAFLAEAGIEVPIVAQLSGDDLFRRLTTLPLDGIVFDCSGPVAPKALALQFAQLVLDRVRAEGA